MRRLVPAVRAAAGITLGVTVLSCAGHTSRGDTGIRPFVFDLWDMSCSSGLHVIYERAPGSRWAAVTTIVGAGSVQDPPGREGLAHVVEHLSIGHSHGPGEASMSARRGYLGNDERAFTSLDQTVYPALVPTSFLRDLLVFEGRRLLRPLEGVDEETFAVEREIVRNELREGHESEAWKASFDATLGVAFPAAHPYHRPVIGTHASLDAMALADAQRFADAYYRPQAMTMVIVGDLPVERVERFVRDGLPPALCGGPPLPRPPARGALAADTPPLADAGPLARASSSVQGPELWIAWTTPGGYGPSRYVGGVWANIAEDAFDRARLDDADVASVSLFAVPQAMASLFVCRVRLIRGDHPEESQRQVIAALPWTDGDDMYLSARFDRAKLGLMRDLAVESENARNRSVERAQFAHFTGGLFAYSAQLDSLKAVDATMGREFARRYLTPERARAVLLQPGGGAPRRAGAVGVRRGEGAPHGPLPPRTMASLIGMRTLDGLRSTTLDNGLQVFILPRPGASVVTTSLVFHGGKSEAGPSLAEAAFEGLKLNWEEWPGDFGISAWFHPAADHIVLTMRGGAGNMGRVLEMASYLVRRWEVDWPSDRFQELRLPLMRRDDAAPGARNARVFMDRMFPGSPFGRSRLADEIAAMKEDELTRWLETELVPANAALVVVGDVDTAAVEQLARGELSGWSERGGARPPLPAVTPGPATPPRETLSAGRTIVQHRPGATQAELLLGCVLPPADATAAAAYTVAARVIRGDLLEPLRTRIGSTYGIDVEPTIWRGGTAMLSLHGLIDNARLGVAVDVLRRFWNDAASRRLTEDARAVEVIQEIGEDRARARLLELDASAGATNALAAAWNRGWPVASVDDEARRLAAVSAADVEATLRACAGHLVFAVSGDEQVVRAALRPRREPAPVPPPAPEPAPPPEAAAALPAP